MLLSDETCAAMMGRIDELIEMFDDLEADDAAFVFNRLGPHLSGLMDETWVAKRRRDAGYSYRETHLSAAGTLALAERLCTLPTKLTR